MINKRNYNRNRFSIVQARSLVLSDEQEYFSMEPDVNSQDLNKRFAELSTPLVADACLRLRLPYHVAPFGIRSLSEASHIAGRVLPVRHYGSVDIFLEVLGMAQQGDILVIDNGGRTDQDCSGDLTAHEAVR